MTDHDKLPYLPLWVKDLLSDRKTLAMTSEDFGAYMLLLCSQWIDGPIAPDDVDGIARCKVHKRVIKCFKKTSSGLVNQRLEKERAKVAELTGKKKAQAVAAARARWEQSASTDTSTKQEAPARTTTTKTKKPSKHQKQSGTDHAKKLFAVPGFSDLYSFADIKTADDLFWLVWNCLGTSGMTEHGCCLVVSKLFEIEMASKSEDIRNPGGACVNAFREGQKPSDPVYRSVCKKLQNHLQE